MFIEVRTIIKTSIKLNLPVHLSLLVSDMIFLLEGELLEVINLLIQYLQLLGVGHKLEFQMLMAIF